MTCPTHPPLRTANASRPSRQVCRAAQPACAVVQACPIASTTLPAAAAGSSPLQPPRFVSRPNAPGVLCQARAASPPRPGRQLAPHLEGPREQVVAAAHAQPGHLGVLRPLLGALHGVCVQHDGAVRPPRGPGRSPGGRVAVPRCRAVADLQAGQGVMADGLWLAARVVTFA